MSDSYLRYTSDKILSKTIDSNLICQNLVLGNKDSDSNTNINISASNGRKVTINGIQPSGGAGDLALPIIPPVGTTKIISGVGDIDLTTGSLNIEILPAVGISDPSKTSINNSTLTIEDLGDATFPLDANSRKSFLNNEELQLSQFRTNGTTGSFDVTNIVSCDGVIMNNAKPLATTPIPLTSNIQIGLPIVANSTKSLLIDGDKVLIQTGLSGSIIKETKIDTDGIEIISSTPKFQIQAPDFSSPVNFYNAFVQAVTTYEAVTYVAPVAPAPATYITGLSTFLPINPGSVYEYNLFNNTQTLFQKYVAGVRSNDPPQVLINYTGGPDLVGNDIMISYDIGVRLISPQGVGIPTFPPNTPISGVGVTPVSLSSSGLECMVSGYNIEPPIPAHNTTNNYFPLTQNWGYINSSLAQALTPVEPIGANIGTLNYLPCLRYLNSALRGGVNINYPVYRILNSTYGVAPSVAGSVTWAITLYPQGLMPHPRAIF